MTRTFIAIDGKHYLWKDILDLRRAQLAADSSNNATQMALFASLREDHRPVEERTASGRYQQPNLFETGVQTCSRN